MENIEIYKKWIYYQCLDKHLPIQVMPQEYRVKWHHKQGKIMFWSNNMIEETIQENNKTVFYLYYPLTDYHFAKKMFETFLTYLLKEQEQWKNRILLCCSGGMTSSFFKTKMNQFLTLNHSLYQVEAAAISDIPYIKEDYDLILVAPQMRYYIPTIEKMAPRCEVQEIEPGIFASYDCGKLYEQIEKYYKGDEAYVMDTKL